MPEIKLLSIDEQGKRQQHANEHNLVISARELIAKAEAEAKARTSTEETEEE